jgi:hypothetical protein
MDKFFYECSISGVSLLKSQLHLIGLSSIFISSKYEDVIPIHMDQIIRDAGHKKYSREDIVEMEK